MAAALLSTTGVGVLWNEGTVQELFFTSGKGALKVSNFFSSSAIAFFFWSIGLEELFFAAGFFGVSFGGGVAALGFGGAAATFCVTERLF